MMLGILVHVLEISTLLSATSFTNKNITFFGSVMTAIDRKIVSLERSYLASPNIHVENKVGFLFETNKI